MSPPGLSPEEIRRQLFDLLSGFMRTQAISVATRLGVPDVVSSTPSDIGDIARAVGADESALYRLMRYLATEGIFTEDTARAFSETPLSVGLRSDAPATARWLALMLGAEHYGAWGEALHSFVTGEPAFDHVHGKSFFEYLGDHPDLSRIFDSAMAAGARGRAAALAEYDWSDVERVVDVGGGNGAALAIVLARHPHLRGTVFDLPTVVEGAANVLSAAGVQDRCDVVGGDFFVDDLPRADVYVLSQILHDWNDERAGAILDNCRRGLTEHDRLLLVERILEDGPDSAFHKLLDLHMLVLLGGKERTETEWRSLLAEHGFGVQQITESGLIEARPV